MKDKPRILRDGYNLPINMNYNVQFKQIEKLFKKHGSILMGDRQLRPILPEQPKFTYRREATIQDIIAKNMSDPPIKSPNFF